MGQDITLSWSAVVWQPYLSALASTSPLPGFSPSAKWLLIPPLSGNELSVLFPRTDEVSARCRPLQYRSLSVVAGLGQFELPRVLSRTPQKHLPQNNLDLFFVYIEGFSESWPLPDRKRYRGPTGKCHSVKFPSCQRRFTGRFQVGELCFALLDDSIMLRLNFNTSL